MDKKFPLATVKRVRELREKQVQREFAKRRQEAALIDRKIESISDRKLVLTVGMNEMRRNKFNPSTDLLYVRYLMRLEDQKIRLRADLKTALDRVAEQRDKVFEAKKLRKTMDILKEKFDEEVRMEESREETKRLGEVAVQRFVREGKGG